MEPMEPMEERGARRRRRAEPAAAEGAHANDPAWGRSLRQDW
ncbi:hypothetical protein [Streptomyces acidicola]